MRAAKNIQQKETVDLLNKCWMTHDGMWFFHCLQEFGKKGDYSQIESQTAQTGNVSGRRTEERARTGRSVGISEQLANNLLRERQAAELQPGGSI